MIDIIVSGMTWFSLGFVFGISLWVITNLIWKKNEK
jgi:hypothetical protein